MKNKFVLALLLTFSVAATNLSAAPQEGDIIQASGPISVIRDGKRCAIPTMEVFKANGFKVENLIKVSEADEQAIPAGTPLTFPVKPYKTAKEGDLIQASSPAVFIIRDGKHCVIPTMELLKANGYTGGNIIKISDEDLEAIPEGPVVQ